MKISGISITFCCIRSAMALVLPQFKKIGESIWCLFSRLSWFFSGSCGAAYQCMEQWPTQLTKRNSKVATSQVLRLTGISPTSPPCQHSSWFPLSSSFTCWLSAWSGDISRWISNLQTVPVRSEKWLDSSVMVSAKPKPWLEGLEKP